MVYLGSQPGVKGYRFMHLKNNTIFLGHTASFDEEMLPKCKTQNRQMLTQIGRKVPSKGENLAKNPPSITEEPAEDLLRLGVPTPRPNHCAPRSPSPAPAPTPPPDTDAPAAPEEKRPGRPSTLPPVDRWRPDSSSPPALRCSRRECQPVDRYGDSVYSQDKTPAQIEREIEQLSSWEHMTGTRTGRSNWFLPLTGPSTSRNVPAPPTETRESSDEQSVSKYLHMATPGQACQEDNKCSDPETVHLSNLC
jgi:hypothetical protein